MTQTKTPFNTGKLSQQLQYQSFSPEFINKPFKIQNSRLLVLLSDADRKIGELNAYSRLIPDIDFFIPMHVKKRVCKIWTN